MVMNQQQQGGNYDMDTNGVYIWNMHSGKLERGMMNDVAMQDSPSTGVKWMSVSSSSHKKQRQVVISSYLNKMIMYARC